MYCRLVTRLVTHRRLISKPPSFSHAVLLIKRSLSCLALVAEDIMRIVFPLQIWLPLLLIVRALVVQRVHDSKPNFTELSLPLSQPILIHSFNQTSLPSGISANKPTVLCDGDQYGRDLIVADCRDAITGLKSTRQRLVFGERSAGQETWDVGLPFRQIGCEDAR